MTTTDLLYALLYSLLTPIVMMVGFWFCRNFPKQSLCLFSVLFIYYGCRGFYQSYLTFYQLDLHKVTALGDVVDRERCSIRSAYRSLTFEKGYAATVIFTTSSGIKQKIKVSCILDYTLLYNTAQVVYLADHPNINKIVSVGDVNVDIRSYAWLKDLCKSIFFMLASIISYGFVKVRSGKVNLVANPWNHPLIIKRIKRKRKFYFYKNRNWKSILGRLARENEPQNTNEFKQRINELYIASYHMLRKDIGERK